MNWQDTYIRTNTEKELYNLLEPIFRERTQNGTDCLMSAFMDLRNEQDQRKIINMVKNGLTNPSDIVLALVDMFPDSD